MQWIFFFFNYVYKIMASPSFVAIKLTSFRYPDIREILLARKRNPIFIDRIALAKQGDNRIGSVRPSVRPPVRQSVIRGVYCKFDRQTDTQKI